MSRLRWFSLPSIALPARALPRTAPWLGAALGVTLGLTSMGCRFDPAGQVAGDGGPGPAVDAPASLDAGQPRDAAPAAPDAAPAAPDAAPGLPDAGGDPRPKLWAWEVEGDDITIDGNLDDWNDDGGGDGWITLAAPAGYVPEHDPGSADAGDISMRFAARWHPSAGLYLAFEVTDDVHASASGNTDVLWRADSVQVGFDVGLNSGSNSYDSIDDFEYGWALASNGQAREHRWVQGSGAPGPVTEFAIVRSGVRTIYEIRMPPSNLGLASLEVGRRIGFSTLANDDDADLDSGDRIRDGWLEWTPGIGSIPKAPSMFGVIELYPEQDDG